MAIYQQRNCYVLCAGSSSTKNRVSWTGTRASPLVRGVLTSFIVCVSASTARSRAISGTDILMSEGSSAGWRYWKSSNFDARKFVLSPVSWNPQIEAGSSPPFQTPSRVTTVTSPRRGWLGINEPTNKTGVSSTCHLCNIKNASSELIFTSEPLPVGRSQASTLRRISDELHDNCCYRRLHSK